MDTTWQVETHGDPIGTVNRFIEQVWQEANLDGLFLSTDTLEDSRAGQRMLTAPEQLKAHNPFKPAMRVNAAHYIPEILRRAELTSLAAVLRPCEIRTLTQLEALDPFPREKLLTICVDCLGTYPKIDLAWRTARRGSTEDLADDTLKFARQGGISVDRYRPACQACRSPAADGADLNFWVIGLPARQYILVNSTANGRLACLNQDKLSLTFPTHEALEMRQRVLARVATRNSRSRERFIQELVSTFPVSITAIAEHLEACGECRECIKACPICSVRHFKRGEDGYFDMHAIAEWLASCAGCGMCEQACPQELPLSAIFSQVHEQILVELSNHKLKSNPISA